MKKETKTKLKKIAELFYEETKQLNLSDRVEACRMLGFETGRAIRDHDGRCADCLSNALVNMEVK